MHIEDEAARIHAEALQKPEEERLQYIQSELRKLPGEQLGPTGTLTIYAASLATLPRRSWWNWVLCGIGVVVLAAGVSLPFLLEGLTPDQRQADQLLLALGPGLIAAAVPGFLELQLAQKKLGLALRAGGGLAVFVLVYLIVKGVLF